MLAFGLCLLLIGFWTLVGLATLSALRPRMEGIRQVLLAPTVGFVVVIILLAIFNRSGLPIGKFGHPFAVILLIVSVIVFLIFRKNIQTSRREWLPFAGLALLGVLVAGWPMFEFGFAWLSLCNDDMANYVLGAQHFFINGYHQTPDVPTLLQGSDNQQFVWFFYILSMSRSACEMTLAWTMSLTGLSGHEVFMPVIFAFHACLILATGALAYQSKELRGAALLSTLLMALSALSTFGALYQLIAQVSGLAVLAAMATAIMRPMALEPWRDLLRDGALAGLLGVGLFLVYPEILPLIGLPWLLYLTISLIRRDPNWGGVLVVVLIAWGITLIVLRGTVLIVLAYLKMQADGAARSGGEGDVFFPFYMIPSGMGAIWGFKPVFRPMLDPLVSIVTGGGLILLLVAAVATVWLSWKRIPAALIGLAMLGLGLVLYQRNRGFGIYKLAMYWQPFVLITLTVAWFSLVKNPRWRVIPLLLIALPGVFVQQGYVDYSRGKGETYVEVPNASPTRINHEFNSIVQAHAQGRNIVSDSYNIVLTKYQAIYTRGHQSWFAGNLFPYSVAGFNERIKGPPPELVELGLKIKDTIKPYRPEPYFNLGRGGEGELDPRSEAAGYKGLRPVVADNPAYQADEKFNRIQVSIIGKPTPEQVDETVLIGCTELQSVFNRSRDYDRSTHVGRNFFVEPLDTVQNHLIFADSRLSQSYFARDQKNVALYQLEYDPIFYRYTTMSGMGRYVSMRVLNTKPRSRLKLELTGSFRADSYNKLPANAVVVGSKVAKIPFVGRGSGRVFSEVIDPQMIDLESFLCIDSGEEGVLMPDIRMGLNRMFGGNVALDWRKMVGFARDISFVSEEEYENLRAPTKVIFNYADNGLVTGAHPLRNRNLEYSGIYEDGWVAEQSFMTLFQPQGSKLLRIRGTVPALQGDTNFKPVVTVLIDGAEVARGAYGVGSIILDVPITTPAGRHKVEIRCDQAKRFVESFERNHQDRRPVSIRLLQVGFELPDDAPPSEIASVPLGLHNPNLHLDGIDLDGWLHKESSFSLTALPEHDQLTIQGMVPKIDNDAFTTEVQILADGQELAKQTVGLGDFTIPIPIKTVKPGIRTLEVKFTHTQTLPAGDARVVGARLTKAAFETLPPRVVFKVEE